MFDFNRVLVVSPHTDDGELGCGGTISRFLDIGKEIFYVAFSICEDSVPKELPKDILETEVKLATGELGILHENLIIYKYPVRYHFQNRQDILDILVKLRGNLNPDLVLIPSSEDIHQDHHTIFYEGLRAFKHTNILGYELPWNNLAFNPAFFVCLEERHIDRKIRALEKYASQSHRSYIKKDFIKGLAMTRGVQVGTAYAEAFEVIRCIIR